MTDFMFVLDMQVKAMNLDFLLFVDFFDRNINQLWELDEEKKNIECINAFYETNSLILLNKLGIIFVIMANFLLF